MTTCLFCDVSIFGSDSLDSLDLLRVLTRPDALSGSGE